jgi:small subunit ribosomal protein S1
MMPSNPKDPSVLAPGSLTEEASFADLLAEHERQQQAAEAIGHTLQGRVIGLQGDAIYVDIGRKQEGVLSLEQLQAAGGPGQVKPGDELVVTVTGRDETGSYTLSPVKVEVPADWSGLQKAFEQKAVIVGVVEEAVKGGLRVNVGVRAFLPASRSGVREVADLEKLVGHQIECRIIKLDTDKEDVVVDRRVVLEERERQAREEAFNAIAEGQVLRGTVRTLTDFGAFVDLGGVDGLLHVADISWQRIAKPEDVLKPGDEVQVKVLKINRDNRRVSLGMKQLQPDPWTVAGETYQVGQRVQGKVVRLTDFGAFVELMPGVEGLIHQSEMSWSKKMRKPSDILKPGEVVEAVVLSVHASEKRIGLGLKQALGDPWDEAPKRYPVGTVVEREVISLTNFGAFVALEEGLEGMIHVSDITNQKRLNHPREILSIGQKVRAQVTEVDAERRRIRLSMKQLEPTSADVFIAAHKPGDQVSGRVASVSKSSARIELAEGVVAVCRLKAQQPDRSESTPQATAADLSALTAMLAAKWREGGLRTEAAKSGLKVGQLLQFRILALEPESKHIEVEIAD